MTQEFKSAGTSLRQIPALHKKVMQGKLFSKNGTNFDNGAGKYMNATEYLAGNEVLNVRFDPFNLPEEVNSKATRYRGMCETSTIANVLNVIKEESIQIEVLKRSYNMLKACGWCFISIYEGNKTGEGKQSKKGCWQNNKRTKEYMDTVKKVFPTCKVWNGIIWAVKE